MKTYRFMIGPFMFSVDARTEEQARESAEDAISRTHLSGLDVQVPDNLNIADARVYPWDNIDQLQLVNVFEDEPDYGGTHEKVGM